MKPFNEVLSSICSTLECEYRERVGDCMVDISEIDAAEEAVMVCLTFNCEIVKDGKVIVHGFASPATSEGITETTKETAREWLLLSLITKCINNA